jgi:hypothetical protein
MATREQYLTSRKAAAEHGHEQMEEMLAMIRDAHLPPRKPRPRAKTWSEHNVAWRDREKAAGGHVTNIAFSGDAWARVGDAKESNPKVSLSGIVSWLIANGVAMNDNARRDAETILALRPEWRDVETVVEIAMDHLREWAEAQPKPKKLPV